MIDRLRWSRLPAALRLAVGLVVALGLGVAPASGQADDEAVSGPEIAEAWAVIAPRLGALDAPELRAREAATRALLEADDLDDEGLWALLRRRGAPGGPALTPEQADRLEFIARARFVSVTPAIGIQFIEAPNRGIRVSALYETAPAARLLEIGDVIVAIDGTVLDGSAGEPRAVLSRTVATAWPGDVLTVVVERSREHPVDGVRTEVLTLPLELGNARRIENFGGWRLEQNRRATWRDIAEGFPRSCRILPADDGLLGSRVSGAADGDRTAGGAEALVLADVRARLARVERDLMQHRLERARADTEEQRARAERRREELNEERTSLRRQLVTLRRVIEAAQLGGPAEEGDEDEARGADDR